MQVSSKLLFRTAIVLLGIMLVLTVLVSMNSQKANATTPSQWEIVRGYIASYFGGTQYTADRNGEGGFRINKTELVARLDSNNDIAPKAVVAPGSSGTAVTGVLGEGDDMANRPVLIDNLSYQAAFVPGTEFRCNWNVDGSCFSSGSITAIRQIVDNHKAAGFSTDIVDHCVSAQTAGPSTGGFGIIAQVPGALSSDTSLIPNVKTLDWARNGWRNAVPAALSTTNATAAPETSAGGYPAPGTPAGTVSPTACDSAADDIALVSCSANWAIASTGGNTGNGQTSIATITAAGQSIDVRSGSISTMSTTTTTNNNLQIPVNSLFSAAGLAYIDPAKSIVVASRTQMGSLPGIGLKMLGYTTIANTSISTGFARWNSTGVEQQIAEGDNLPLQSTTGLPTTPASATYGRVDTTGPSVSSVGSTNVDFHDVDIERTAGEPATMKVEYGTTSGGPYTGEVNDKVLNAVKDAAAGNGPAVHLSGLDDGVTYYYRVTSYDGYANGTVSAEGSFATPAECIPAKPDLRLSTWYAFWASYADYTAGDLSVKLRTTNAGVDTAFAAAITGSTNTNGVTLLTATPISLGNIAGGANVVSVVKYHVPTGVGHFYATVTGSANDTCGTPWTY